MYDEKRNDFDKNKLEATIQQKDFVFYILIPQTIDENL